MGRWLLIRGLGRESAHWLEFAEKFKAQNAEVMMLDLPGTGEHLHKKSPISISAITEQLRNEFLRKKRSTREPWKVMGISLGGMIALDWVNRYPYDFEAASVINTSSKDVGAIWQRLTVFGWYKLLQAGSITNPRMREKTVLDLVSNLRKNDQALLDKLEAIAIQRPISRENLCRQLIASSAFLSPSKIRIPLLILASLKDHMVDVRCSKSLAENLSAQIKFHPEAGHDLSLDDPDWVVDRLKEFESSLTKVEPPPS